MKSSRLIGCLLPAAAFLPASAANAAVLYSAPPDYTQTSFQSTSAPGGEQEASPFLVGGTSTIRSVTWWGEWSGNASGGDLFTFGLYTGSSSPNATASITSAALSLTDTDLGFMGSRRNEEYEYTATLATPFTATGGTQYYISILDANGFWLWQFDGSGKNFFRAGGDGNAWTSSNFPEQDAFQLSDAVSSVPEPFTLSLFGAGLAGAAFFRRRRNTGKQLS